MGKVLDRVGAGVLKVFWYVVGGSEQIGCWRIWTGWGRSDLWLSGEKGF